MLCHLPTHVCIHLAIYLPHFGLHVQKRNYGYCRAFSELLTLMTQLQRKRSWLPDHSWGPVICHQSPTGATGFIRSHCPQLASCFLLERRLGACSLLLALFCTGTDFCLGFPAWLTGFRELRLYEAEELHRAVSEKRPMKKTRAFGFCVLAAIK